MKHNSSDTAVLIFARSAQKESLSKIISRDSKQNLRFWQFLNNHVIQTVASSGLSYYISDESSQCPGNFGQKLSSAVESIFSKGYSNVIVIGNDCLALKSKHIRAAHESLQNRTSAIGADHHGGAYLIAVNRTAFKKSAFDKIPWQTAKVYESLVQFCDNNFLDLEKLSDLNNREALDDALSSGKIPVHIALAIWRIFNPKTTTKFFSVISHTQYRSSANVNKGSPFGFVI